MSDDTVSERSITLELAAFLDSPQARALADVRREDQRTIAQTFLAVCYEELGKVPSLLDGEDVAVALSRSMPARLASKDPLADSVPAVLAAFFDHLEETRVVSQAFEIRRALEEGAEVFLQAVRRLPPGHTFTRPPRRFTASRTWTVRPRRP